MGENRFGNGWKCRLFWLVGKMMERKHRFLLSFFFFFLLHATSKQKSQSLVYNVQHTRNSIGHVPLIHHPDESTTTFQIHIGLTTLLPPLQYLHLTHRNLSLPSTHSTPILAPFSQNDTNTTSRRVTYLILPDYRVFQKPISLTLLYFIQVKLHKFTYVCKAR